MPDDLKAVVARHLDAYALKQRVATATENEQLKQQLAARRLASNGEFVEKLRTSGYYAQWKSSFGDELWEIWRQ